MQSYPIGKINFAARVTSASIANIASFATLKVATSSFGINYPGPIGASGSTFAVSGTVGPQGPAGPQGPPGLGVYLLSSSLVTCSYAFSLGSAATAETACSAGTSTYYSANATLANGVFIYYDTRRTVAAFAGYYSNGTNAWSNDGSGQLTDQTTCVGGSPLPPPPPSGGGGGCTGYSCTDGVGCPEGCYCSTNEGMGTCVAGGNE